MGSVPTVSYEGASRSLEIGNFPDECPFCHGYISPRLWGMAYGEVQSYRIQAVFLCTNIECRELFIAYYTYNDLNTHWSLVGVTKGTRETTEFSDEIKEVSSNFVKIFAQAEI